MDSNGLVGPLDALPPEIISMIISYLPLDDRKNVRLTCQMLYSCCNSRSIREKEKFVFRTCNYANDFVRILENPKFVSLINLEFQDNNTEYVFPNVWKLCGSRIRSAEFYKCCLDEWTLRDMLRYCVNLTSIAIYNKHCHISDFFVVRVIDDFNANKMTYPQLLKFVYEPEDPLDVETVRRIFSIFPNIQQFSGDFCCSEREMLEPSEVPTQLCSLTWNPRHWLNLNKIVFRHIPLLMPVEHLRLTKYEEHIPFDFYLVSNESQKAMLNFFSLQTNLQNVTLTASSFHGVDETFEPSPFDKKVILHILRTCPHLRELIFHSNGKVRLNIDEAKEFLNLISKLRVLVLKNPFGFEKMELTSLPISLALDTLCIESDRRRNSRDRFLEYLFRHTRNLQRLGLTHPTDSLLQIIFNTMPHLRTLILRNLRDCTEEGFFCLDSADNRHFFLSKMQGLEYLDLSFGKIENEMVERIIREIKLPCLKHLRLQKTRDEIPLGALRIALSSMSLLNALDIGYVEEESLEKIANLCKGLKKLRYLTLWRPSINRDYIENLLEQCPTLRFVHINLSVFGRNPSNKGWIDQTFQFGFRLSDQKNLSDWLKSMTAGE